MTKLVQQTAWLAVLVLLGACTPNSSDGSAEGTSSAPASASGAAPALPKALDVPGISGQQMVRLGKDLLVADEQHGAFRTVALPLTKDSPTTELKADGPLAQIAAFGDKAWATQRNPGALIEFTRDKSGTWSKTRSLPVAADAWGVSLQGDGKVAYVTSAWTHKLTRIDLVTWKVSWEANLTREPRGIAVTKDGKRLYVSHLTDYRVTQIDNLSNKTPTVTLAEPATAPSLTSAGTKSAGTLGYSLMLYDNDKRLALPRRALTAIAGDDWAADSWAGVGTVDVMSTRDNRVFGSPSSQGVRFQGSGKMMSRMTLFEKNGQFPVVGTRLTDMRAIVYRPATQTFLVADQAMNRVVELDAHTLTTGLDSMSIYDTGSKHGKFDHIARAGVAPSAIALSEDTATAYIYCHATHDVLAISLDTHPTCDSGCDDNAATIVVPRPKAWPRRRLAEDALIVHAADKKMSPRLAKQAALGRALFFDSGQGEGMACSSCHPDGRDDGHTWHEMHIAGREPHDSTNPFAEHANNGAVYFTSHAGLDGKGVARQTPMLVNRTRVPGPYGWRGESKTLVDRIDTGFQIHGWNLMPHGEGKQDVASASLLALFLKMRGLVEPPPRRTQLNDQQQRGKALFMSEKVGCSSCHDPARHYTDRLNAEIMIPKRSDFLPEPGAFRTPSLTYVGASPPYYHNGSVTTLAKLVAGMGDRMGKTSHLTDDDRAALVAFLETL